MSRKTQQTTTTTGTAIAVVFFGIIVISTLLAGYALFSAVHQAAERRLDRYYYDNPSRGH